MGFSLLPKETEYFALFKNISAKLREASAILVEMLEGDPKEYDSLSKKIKSIEHECDELTHNVTTKLNTSFITPFDREDIYTLAVGLDDVCDYIDAGARAIVMYNIRETNKHAVSLAHIIDKLTDSIHSAADHLKKSKGLEKYLLEIQRLENDADEVYYRAMGELFANAKDPIDVIKWKEVYEILENATDKCEAVGNIIESIVLKHA
ncbi:MAG: putative phosphate transport regulator [Acidobacteria bacterium OLB17]|nr:MAG: putative phosphate transport regulator [Acidobacteria bacterium OLB17]MCZ2390472.1 DUF47 family protein [Acidobacteriota bacterium]